MPTYALTLDRPKARQPQFAGGKGASLAWLKSLGLRVPAGFVLTPAALEAHLRRLGVAPPEGPSDSREALSERIIQSELPPAVSRRLLRGYRRLGGPVAVRSSALVEDSRAASCAGQLSTFLNVDGAEELARAIRRCWASLYSPQVAGYLAERGLLAERSLGELLPMAIVVQRMVPARVAGVAFTADPLTGERHLLIEAVAGLGDQLVSGQAQPDRYRLDSRGALFEVEALDPARPLLSEAQALELAQLLWRVAAHADDPQDIEWAWDGRAFWLLQSRPITSLAGRRVYSHRLAATMSPGIIKPLIWSLNTTSKNANVFGRLFGELLGSNDIDWTQLTRRIHSRVYLDTKTFGQAFERLGLPPNVMQMMFLGDRPAHHPRLRLNPRLLVTLLRTLRAAWRYGRLYGEGRRFVEGHDRDLQPYREADWSAVGPGELLAQADALRRLHADTQWYTMLSAMNMTIRSNLLRRWLGRWAPQADPEALMLGLKGIKGLEPAARLRELAALARELDAESQALLANGDDAAIRDRLAMSAPGRRLLAGLAGYLARYGFLNSNGTDFSRAPWAETPELIWRAIGQTGARAHQAAGPNAAELRLAARAEVLARLGPLKRRLLSSLLDATTRYIQLKEHCSLLMSEDSYQMRRLCLATADRLAAAGALNQRDDIFMLAYDEVQALVGSELAPELARQRIAERWAETARDAQARPPEIICEGLEWSEPWERAEPGRRLVGIGGSPGQRRGRARILLDPAQTPADLSHEDILVVPFTDVGWTPLFATVGGIVAETGGRLCHSAIVAREYGLPAVVGVQGACQLIREGQIIRIDGGRGSVDIDPLVAESASADPAAGA